MPRSPQLSTRPSQLSCKACLSLTAMRHTRNVLCIVVVHYNDSLSATARLINRPSSHCRHIHDEPPASKNRPVLFCAHLIGALGGVMSASLCVRALPTGLPSTCSFWSETRQCNVVITRQCNHCLATDSCFRRDFSTTFTSKIDKYEMKCIFHAARNSIPCMFYRFSKHYAVIRNRPSTESSCKPCLYVIDISDELSKYR